MESISQFALLLQTAFHGRSDLPKDCSISLAISENQHDYSDVAQIIETEDETPQLVKRIRRTHPPGRPHLDEFDRHFWTVMVEAGALAWASTSAGLPGIRFTDDDGTPDLVTSNNVFIEVKTIHRSPQEQKKMRAMANAGFGVRGPEILTSVHPNMIKKFDDGLQDAIKKRDRQQGANLIVYYRLDGVDWPMKWEEAWRLIELWAGRASAATGVRVVVIRGGHWDSPFVDIDLTCPRNMCHPLC